MCPDFPVVGGSAAEVWTYATRELTDKTGFEISGVKTKLDDLQDLAQVDILADATPFNGADVPDIKARADATPAFEAAVEASIAMDGNELTLVAKADDKMGLLDGYIDLTPMQGGDTIVIRQYMQIKAAGAYVKYAEQSYPGVQAIPLLAVTTKAAKDKIKVTAQQTAGVYRTLDVQFYRRVEA